MHLNLMAENSFYIDFQIYDDLQQIFNIWWRHNIVQFVITFEVFQNTSDDIPTLRTIFERRAYSLWKEQSKVIIYFRNTNESVPLKKINPQKFSYAYLKWTGFAGWHVL